MKSTVIWPILGLFILAFGVYSYESWRWSECRSVGHSKAYCVMQVGK